MALELSYAGVELPLESAPLRRWVEERLSLDDLRELAPAPPWPGRNLAGLAFAPGPAPPRARVGQLFYPSGLSRWAEARFAVTSRQLRRILARTYGRPEEEAAFHLAYPQDLVMRPGITGGRGEYRVFGEGIKTKMYLLPPRPVADFHPKLDGLYLITLVDERYYFQWGHGGLTTPGAASSWAGEVTLLTQALHLNDFAADLTIPAAYGRPDPDSPYWSLYESAALLLEAVLANIGYTVARGYDGLYVPWPWSAAREVIRANRRRELLAGGTLLDDTADSPLRVRLAAVLPRSVTVTFPRYKPNRGYVNRRQHAAWFQDSYGDVYPVVQTLEDLGDPYKDYWRFSNHARDTRVIRDTAKAFFTNINDTTPTNDAELQALAARLARDYFDSVLAGVADETYPGIYPWQPDGATDLLFSFRYDRCQTRVLPRPGNLAVTQMGHAFTTTGLVPRDQIGGTDLTVEEADGVPSFGGVVRLVFDNGAVTRVEDGVARVTGTPGPPGGAITVQSEIVGGGINVTVPSVTTLRVSEPPGFRLDSPAAGVARLTLAAASRTVTGVMTTSTQAFGGLKLFHDGVWANQLRIYATTDLSGTDYAFVSALGLTAELGHVSAAGAPIRLIFNRTDAKLVLDGFGVDPSYAVSHGGVDYVGIPSGTFTTTDGQTVTVRGGLIVGLVIG